MPGRALNLLTMFSLLLFSAVAALWARSYWRGDEVYRLSRGRGLYADLSRGVVMLYRDRTPIQRPDVEWGHALHADTRAQRRSTDAIAARVASRTGNGFDLLGVSAWTARPLGHPPTVVRVPLWLPAGLLLVLPALRLRRLARRPAGHCRACGYDLRASPGRCPECGRLPAAE